MGLKQLPAYYDSEPLTAMWLPIKIENGQYSYSCISFSSKCVQFSIRESGVM